MSGSRIIPQQPWLALLRQAPTTTGLTRPHLPKFSIHRTLQQQYLQTPSPFHSSLRRALHITRQQTTRSFQPNLSKTSKTTSFVSAARRTASTNATNSGGGPLLNRVSNRPLPDIPRPSLIWLRTFPLFAVLIVLSTLAIFNYQKSSSSVISSILYALRRSPQARELLGDEIYFASSVPWIRGEINQLHGRIDVRFWVKGTKGQGEVEYKCERRGGRGGVFEALEWKLKGEQGQVIELLEGGGVMPEA